MVGLAYGLDMRDHCSCVFGSRNPRDSDAIDCDVRVVESAVKGKSWILNDKFAISRRLDIRT